MGKHVEWGNIQKSVVGDVKKREKTKSVGWTTKEELGKDLEDKHET